MRKKFEDEEEAGVLEAWIGECLGIDSRHLKYVSSEETGNVNCTVYAHPKVGRIVIDGSILITKNSMGLNGYDTDRCKAFEMGFKIGDTSGDFINREGIVEYIDNSEFSEFFNKGLFAAGKKAS